jgi:hypothetical protein
MSFYTESQRHGACLLPKGVCLSRISPQSAQSEQRRTRPSAEGWSCAPPAAGRQEMRVTTDTSTHPLTDVFVSAVALISWPRNARRAQPVSRAASRPCVRATLLCSLCSLCGEKTLQPTLISVRHRRASNPCRTGGSRPARAAATRGDPGAGRLCARRCIPAGRPAALREREPQAQ